MPWEVGFLGGTLVTDAGVPGYCSRGVFTLRTAVSCCCDSVVAHILLSCLMIFVVELED